MIHVAGRQRTRRERAGWLEGFFAHVFARPAPIELVEQRFNFLPARFRRNGELWRVRGVLRVWDEAATALLPPRRYFHVRCDDGGERVLFQDLRLGMWYSHG